MEEVWNHIRESHKDKIMAILEPNERRCHGCGKEMVDYPMPFVVDGKLQWFVPIFCERCLGNIRDFLVDKVNPKLSNKVAVGDEKC